MYRLEASVMAMNETLSQLVREIRSPGNRGTMRESGHTEIPLNRSNSTLEEHEMLNFYKFYGPLFCLPSLHALLRLLPPSNLLDCCLALR